MRIARALPAYVEGVNRLFGHARPQWLHNDLPAGSNGRGLRGYVYLINAQMDRNPLRRRSMVESERVRTETSFNCVETWGLQIWGDRADDMMYDLAAGWADEGARDIAFAQGFAVRGVSGLTAVDEAVLATDKRAAQMRMSLDFDLAYVLTATRMGPLTGGVIERIPLTVRRGADIRQLDVSLEDAHGR